MSPLLQRLLAQVYEQAPRGQRFLEHLSTSGSPGQALAATAIGEGGKLLAGRPGILGKVGKGLGVAEQVLPKIKLSAHADQRAKERTKIKPHELRDLRSLIKTLKLHPKKDYYYDFGGRGYGAIGPTAKDGHVLMTVLSPHMTPRGERLKVATHDKEAKPRWAKQVERLGRGELQRLQALRLPEREVRTLGKGGERIADLVMHPQHGLAVRKIPLLTDSSTKHRSLRESQRAAQQHMEEKLVEVAAGRGDFAHLKGIGPNEHTRYYDYVPGKSQGAALETAWKRVNSLLNKPGNTLYEIRENPHLSDAVKDRLLDRVLKLQKGQSKLKSRLLFSEPRITEDTRKVIHDLKKEYPELHDLRKSNVVGKTVIDLSPTLGMNYHSVADRVQEPVSFSKKIYLSKKAEHAPGIPDREKKIQPVSGYRTLRGERLKLSESKALLALQKPGFLRRMQGLFTSGTTQPTISRRTFLKDYGLSAGTEVAKKVVKPMAEVAGGAAKAEAAKQTLLHSGATDRRAFLRRGGATGAYAAKAIATPVIENAVRGVGGDTYSTVLKGLKQLENTGYNAAGQARHVGVLPQVLGAGSNTQRAMAVAKNYPLHTLDFVAGPSTISAKMDALLLGKMASAPLLEERVPDDDYVYSAVPRVNLESALKKGLYSQRAMLKDPEVLKAFLAQRAAAGMPDTEEAMRARVDGPATMMTETYQGPSIFFTPPDPDKVSDPRHYVNRFDTVPLRINLTRLLRDLPETRVRGAELRPYDIKGPRHQGHLRTRDLTLDDVRGYTATDPTELWKHYNSPEYTHYASDVPHAQVITPSGVIPPEYIEREKKAEHAPGIPDRKKLASLRDEWWDLSPLARRVVTGTVLGGPVGAAAGYALDEDDRGRGAAVGALGGLGLGAGAGALFNRSKPISAAVANTNYKAPVYVHASSYGDDFRDVMRSPSGSGLQDVGVKGFSHRTRKAQKDSIPFKDLPHMQEQYLKDRAGRDLRASIRVKVPEEYQHLNLSPENLGSQSIKEYVGSKLNDSLGVRGVHFANPVRAEAKNVKLRYDGPLQHDPNVSAEINELRRVLRLEQRSKKAEHAPSIPDREKIAVTLQQLRAGFARIAPRTSSPGTILDQFKALAIPGKNIRREKYAPTLKRMATQQKEIFGPAHSDVTKKLEPLYNDSKNFGKAFVQRDAGSVLGEGHSVRQRRNLRTFAGIHEGQELKALPDLGSLHMSRGVLIDDLNLLHRLQGKGSKGVVDAVYPIREPEKKLLEKQFAEVFKDPRAAQYLQFGSKVPKAMRGAFLRKQVSTSGDDLRGVMLEQRDALTEKARKVNEAMMRGKKSVGGDTTFSLDELPADMRREVLRMWKKAEHAPSVRDRGRTKEAKPRWAKEIAKHVGKAKSLSAWPGAPGRLQEGMLWRDAVARDVERLERTLLSAEKDAVLSGSNSVVTRRLNGLRRQHERAVKDLAGADKAVASLQPKPAANEAAAIAEAQRARGIATKVEAAGVKMREIQPLGSGAFATGVLYGGRNPIARTPKDPLFAAKLIRDYRSPTEFKEPVEYFQAALKERKGVIDAVPREFRPRQLGAHADDVLGVELQEFAPLGISRSGMDRAAELAQRENPKLWDIAAHAGNVGKNLEGKPRIFDAKLRGGHNEPARVVSPGVSERSRELNARRGLSNALRRLEFESAHLRAPQQSLRAPLAQKPPPVAKTVYDESAHVPRVAKTVYDESAHVPRVVKTPASVPVREDAAAALPEALGSVPELNAQQLPPNIRKRLGYLAAGAGGVGTLGTGVYAYQRHKAAEHAPGIPDRKKIQPIPEHKTPQEWEYGIHEHHADRRGKHLDLRLGDPDTEHAHSWALTEQELPDPGKSTWAIQQPTHTLRYMDFKGKIEKGYGKGDVKLKDRAKAELLYSRPDHLAFAVYRGKGPEEYVLHKIHEDRWKLYNQTTTKDTHNLPDTKPKYKEMKPEDIDFKNKEQIVQAKIDGAHNLFVLPKAGKQIRVMSYRPSERKSGVIEHTHKTPLLGIKTPAGLGGTVLRGELYATDQKGVSLSAKDIAGMLNANVWKSREKQEDLGKLRSVVFDVVKHKGRDVQHLPYTARLDLVKRIASQIEPLEMPQIARTSKEKEKLLKAIETGKVKETKEGVIVWDPKRGPIKAKFRPEHDVYIRKLVPGTGKYKDRATGKFQYSHTPKGEIVGSVGTGFSDNLRKHMYENPALYTGMVAKVTALEQYMKNGKPGALRAPALKEFHLDKNPQERLDKVKMAVVRAKHGQDERTSNGQALALAAGVAATMMMWKRGRTAVLSQNPALRKLQKQVGNRRVVVDQIPGKSTTTTQNRLGLSVGGLKNYSKEQALSPRAQKQYADSAVFHVGHPTDYVPMTKRMGKVNVNTKIPSWDDYHPKTRFYSHMQKKAPDAIPETVELADLLKEYKGSWGWMNKRFDSPENFLIKKTHSAKSTLADQITHRDLLEKPKLMEQLARDADKYHVQRKLPIKNEYRVHVLNNEPYAMHHRWTPPGLKKLTRGLLPDSAGTNIPVFNTQERREVYDFVRNAMKDMPLHDGHYAPALDVARLRDGSIKIIEANPAMSGAMYSPTTANSLHRAMTGRDSPTFAGMKALALGGGIAGPGLLGAQQLKKDSYE